MITKPDLIKSFEELKNPANYPDAASKRRRGREFEKFLRTMLEVEGLSPKVNSFRPKGEEMDGSFIYGQRVYLLEAKWHVEPLPASSIYQFKGKVDGKLIGTIGIFVSMSGFSNDAIDALMYGKSVNIILFDGEDIEKCVRESNGFIGGFEQKLRAAAEIGVPYYSLVKETYNIPQSNRPTQQLQDIAIIVEGKTDTRIVSFLAQQILRQANISRRFIVREAGGKLAIPRLANAIDDFNDVIFNDGNAEYNNLKLIVVADADNDVEETYRLLETGLNGEAAIVIPDPEIENWFKQFDIYDTQDLKKYIRDVQLKANSPLGLTVPDPISNLLMKLDINELYKSDNSFRIFHEALTS